MCVPWELNPQPFALYIYFIYIYIRGGTVQVFVPNRHGTDLSFRCMRPYDEYRQFTPNLEGALAVMQPCLITASSNRRTTNAVSCTLETIDIYVYDLRQ